jgi:hypothetical protein
MRNDGKWKRKGVVAVVLALPIICEVYILSCNVGLGKIGQELANGTGCKVYAPNGYCYPNRKEPDDSKIVPKTRSHPVNPGGGDEFVPFDPQP